MGLHSFSPYAVLLLSGLPLPPTGMAKDLAAFAERWVYGRGCPRLTAGFTFMRRTNTLAVAIK